MYDIEKEKREAINAGNRALNSLRTARENLNSAKNWGLADTAVIFSLASDLVSPASSLQIW